MKLFPAQLWTPDTLKALRAVGSFGDMTILPSGGIEPSTVSAWLRAGAAAVGMGSCLVGDDVRVAPTADPALLEVRLCAAS